MTERRKAITAKRRASAKDGSRGPGSPSASKIKSLAELKTLLAGERRRGRRIALCHGVFDLLHPGHIVHFRQAREHGDLLVVTVTPDRFVNKGPGRPHFSETMRLDALAALQDVDFVALNEWPTAIETIRLLRPDVYVKGSDYSKPEKDLSGKIGEEAEAVRAVGGRLVLTEGFTSSSSRLINRFFSAYPKETQQYLERLRGRYAADEMIGRLKKLSDLKVLVIGEAILDQYSFCIPVGKSPKETVVATRHAFEERFAGGAVATANHIGGFCKEATLLTALGPDAEEEAFLRGKMRPNVRMESARIENRPTVRKRRFVDPSGLRKMFEIQYLDDTPLAAADESRFGERMLREIARHDLVVVNDFGHGLIGPKLRETLSGCGKFLALNTQANSANHGFNTVTNYSRADFVAIDEPELRLAARDKYGKIPDLAAAVRRHLKAKTFLVSRGPHGAAALSDEGWAEAPALAVRIVDTVGAGDALFSVTAPCAYRGVPPEMLVFIGNCVGALAVEIVCNRESVGPVELYKFIETLLK